MRIRIWHNGTWKLKIFFSISLGVHLLFLSLATFLFPGVKIDRLPALNIEVSLLPLITEERPISIPFPHPKEKTQIRKEEKNLLQRDSKEELAYKKELESEFPPSVQTVATNILTEEPKPLPIENRRLELGNEKEPVIQAMNLSSPSDSALTFKEENLSIAMPQSNVYHGSSHPNIIHSGEPRNVVKLQTPSGGEIILAQPKYAENPKPLYPQEARKKGYEGEVLLRVEVLSNGRVGNAEVRKSSGYELLDRSALTTVKQWKFIPARRGEEAISLWVNIPIKFQLQ